jgi:hypothetical protein
MFLIIFLHYILFTARATEITMQAPLLRLEILLPDLLLARVVRARH